MNYGFLVIVFVFSCLNLYGANLPCGPALARALGAGTFFEDPQIGGDFQIFLQNPDDSGKIPAILNAWGDDASSILKAGVGTSSHYDIIVERDADRDHYMYNFSHLFYPDPSQGREDFRVRLEKISPDSHSMRIEYIFWHRHQRNLRSLRPSFPSFLRQIASQQNPWTLNSGATVLNENVVTLSDAVSISKFLEILNNPERRFAVVYFSKSSDGTYFMDPAVLAQRLAGVAVVFAEALPYLAFRAAGLFPFRNVLPSGGLISVYGPQRHLEDSSRIGFRKYGVDRLSDTLHLLVMNSIASRR